MKIALRDSSEEHLQLMRQPSVEYMVSGPGPPLKFARFDKIV